MAQRPVAAERLDRREPSTLIGELRVAERVDAAVHADQPPLAQAHVDGVDADAVGEQLTPGHDAVLGGRERRDEAVVVELTGHMPV